MTTGISPTSAKQSAVFTPIRDVFTPQPIQPQKIAQEMPNIFELITKPMSEAVVAGIATILALPIAGIISGISALKSGLNQLGANFNAAANSTKEEAFKSFAIWLATTGTAKASYGNPRLKAVYDKFLARADVKNILAQAGVRQVDTRSTSILSTKPLGSTQSTSAIVDCETTITNEVWKTQLGESMFEKRGTTKGVITEGKITIPLPTTTSVYLPGSLTPVYTVPSLGLAMISYPAEASPSFTGACKLPTGVEIPSKVIVR